MQAYFEPEQAFSISMPSLFSKFRLLIKKHVIKFAHKVHPVMLSQVMSIYREKLSN